MFAAALLLLFGVTIGSARVAAAAGVQPRSQILPFSAEIFTNQEFDEAAPFCRVDKDPCGFYDLSLDGNSQLEWVKSWCRCPAKHECVFDEPDLRHRVYRFVCRKEYPQQRGGGLGGTNNMVENSRPNRNRLVVRRTRHRHQKADEQQQEGKSMEIADRLRQGKEGTAIKDALLAEAIAAAAVAAQADDGDALVE